MVILCVSKFLQTIWKNKIPVEYSQLWNDRVQECIIQLFSAAWGFREDLFKSSERFKFLLQKFLIFNFLEFFENRKIAYYRKIMNLTKLQVSL